MTRHADFTLAELAIVAAAEAWRGSGEVLATGIGTIPRIAVGLAKLTFAPELMLTDGEAFLVERPVPLGDGDRSGVRPAGWMPYARVFDNVWSGRRHAMVTPVQIDRWGQTNISCIGDIARPKVQLLGMRGFPGNSINHVNSLFVPRHDTRTFVSGEVDAVSGIGFKAGPCTDGVRRDQVAFGRIVSDLCVMDFAGPDRSVRLVSLHPGVTVEEVRAATGFPVHAAEGAPETPVPDAAQLAVIRELDPDDRRARVFNGNPGGRR